MNQQQATNLFNQLREGLLATQSAIETIIETKAWEPLGYETFQEAWDDRLSDIKLSGTMRATVVYAMFDQGATDTDIAMTISGVGPKRARSYKQAHKAGLPAKQAETHVDKMIRVKPYTRSLPEKRNSITLSGFADDELSAWNELAKDLGVDRNEMLRDALREAMADIMEVEDYDQAA